MSDRKTILWAEDDPFFKSKLIPFLENAGFRVLEAIDAQAAIQLMTSHNERIELVVLDVAMPHGGAFSEILSKGGHETGLLLGSWILDRYPHIPIVGFSVYSSLEVHRWFDEYGCRYFRKGVEEWRMIEFIKRKLGTGHLRHRCPRIFIVHGHDEKLIASIRDLLTGVLGSAEIVVLRDLPGKGRTLIEKFEQEAELIDLVVVLLTPDDVAFPRRDTAHLKGRSRQNVIFELGYFYAKLQRTRGRVLVLCKGNVEKPSDLAGIEYIAITKDIATVTNKIRQELSDWL
jgi:CheY-like chemotaxis protein